MRRYADQRNVDGHRYRVAVVTWRTMRDYMVKKYMVGGRLELALGYLRR
jgi:hypothetical protein